MVILPAAAPSATRESIPTPEGSHAIFFARIVHNALKSPDSVEKMVVNFPSGPVQSVAKGAYWLHLGRKVG
jgi:hypothetical protein